MEMSDSDIILATPDTTVNELLFTDTPSVCDVVDSSIVESLNASVAESVIGGRKKKKAMVLSSSSSDDETSNSSKMELSMAGNSMNMSVDKSAVQTSYRDMSIDSRSPSPEIVAISDDEEDDLFVVDSNDQNTSAKTPLRVKLRGSLLTPHVQGYKPFTVQHSTPIKHNEKHEDEKDTIENPTSTDFSVFKVPDAPNQDSDKSIEIIAVEAPSSKIEVSQTQFLQQKQNIQKLTFDIIRLKNTMQHLDLKKLPDNGSLLKSNLSKLEQERKDSENLLANMVVIEGLKPLKPVKWENLETGLGLVQPNTFGKRALQTHNFQKSLTLDALKELHGSLNTCPDENTYAKDPKGLKVELMPHQKHALAWLKWREGQKPSGGILADDMGLGKTLTMISMILNCNQHSEENEPPVDGKINGRYYGGTLVICPASLIYQWEAEIKKHVRSGLLSVDMYHGNNREEKAKRLAKQDIVLTTYSIVMRQNKENATLFNVNWRRIILDEAHQVRNHKSQTSMAVCALFGKSRWALTGTPVHNKELDLYALLKFIRCSPFDDLAVWKRWVANKATVGQDRLNTVLSALILRRTKEQLAQKKLLTCLPEKEWHLIEVALEAQEMQIYQKVLIFSRTLFAQYLHQRAEKDTRVLSNEDGLNNPDSEYFKMHKRLIKLRRVKPIKQHEILVLLLRLRQICCHPSLIKGMLQGGENCEEFADGEECEEMNILDELNKLNINEEEAVESVADGLSHEDDRVGLAEAAKSILNPTHPIFVEKRPSSKIKKVLDIVDTVLEKNEKLLIVSQWTKMLDLLGMQLKSRSIKYYQLDGSVPVPKRMDIVQDINNPSKSTKILLLSLTAGGVGLNLVGANNLILLDLHWNPQLEIQAQDRIYRVGQTKPVKIYKIISNDTIEQRIKQLQEKKLQLSEELLTGSGIQDRNKLSLDDLKMLFNM